MREKPDLRDAAVQDCLSEQYGLRCARVDFLPRGGDIDAAVYHVLSGDGTAYILKLRRGAREDAALRVAQFLSGEGIRAVIAPVMTRSRQLWAQLGDYQAVLYPFIEGQNAFEAPLTGQQWVEFGAALKAIHQAVLPAALAQRVPHETYSPVWTGNVKALLARVAAGGGYPDKAAAQWAGQMALKAGDILDIVRKAEWYGSILHALAPAPVLCHSDLHAGNLLVDARGSLFMVDCDAPIFAPKERDLMFIGGGVGSAWYTLQEEELFYQGYGAGAANPVGLAYYRFERIAQDIAEWGERMLLGAEGGQDRARWVQGFKRWFAPHDVVEMAYQAEKQVPPELRL